jgi:hypothetical protein
MSDVDISGAVEALQSELPESTDAPTSLDESFVEDQPAGDVESFTGFNPNDLPEDLQSVYRSMQGDYTRKTQEIAELRRNYEQYDAFSESGVDPNYALQAADFYRKLDTDPQFAKQVVDNIQRNLGNFGVEQQDVIGDAPYESNVEGYDSLPLCCSRNLRRCASFGMICCFSRNRQKLLLGTSMWSRRFVSLIRIIRMMICQVFMIWRILLMVTCRLRLIRITRFSSVL